LVSLPHSPSSPRAQHTLHSRRSFQKNALGNMIESSKFGAGAAYRDLFQAPMTPSNIINPKPKSGVYAKSGSCWRCSRLQGVGSSLSCQNNLVVSYQDKFIVSCQDIFVHTHKCVNPTVPLILLHSIYTTRQLLKAGKKRLFPGFRFQASRQKIQEIPILRRRRNLKKTVSRLLWKQARSTIVLDSTHHYIPLPKRSYLLDSQSLGYQLLGVHHVFLIICRRGAYTAILPI